jgi:hypothetical protein
MCVAAAAPQHKLHALPWRAPPPFSPALHCLCVFWHWPPVSFPSYQGLLHLLPSLRGPLLPAAPACHAQQPAQRWLGSPQSPLMFCGSRVEPCMFIAPFTLLPHYRPALICPAHRLPGTGCKLTRFSFPQCMPTCLPHPYILSTACIASMTHAATSVNHKL